MRLRLSPLAFTRVVRPPTRVKRLAVALPKACVYLLQHPRLRAQLFLRQFVERRLHGVEVGVEVFGVAAEVAGR